MGAPSSSRWFTKRGDIIIATITLRIDSAAVAAAGDLPGAMSRNDVNSSGGRGRRKAGGPNDVRNPSAHVDASGEVPAQLPASAVSRLLLEVAPFPAATATSK